MKHRFMSFMSWGNKPKPRIVLSKLITTPYTQKTFNEELENQDHVYFGSWQWTDCPWDICYLKGKMWINQFSVNQSWLLRDSINHQWGVCMLLTFGSTITMTLLHSFSVTQLLIQKGIIVVPLPSVFSQFVFSKLKNI